MDILVFTGGVGENQAVTRRDVCRNMEYMGIELNEELNDAIHFFCRCRLGRHK